MSELPHMPEPTLHGGAVDDMVRQYPEAPQPWLDLSTGINPWPYTMSATRLEHFNRLPLQTEMQELCAVAAAAFGTSANLLVAAGGSELLISMLPHVLPGLRRIAVAEPSYGDYARAWGRVGTNVIRSAQPLRHTATVDAIVVANPNNPDGHIYTTQQLFSAHAQLQQHGGWLIVDEAYADLYPELSVARAAGAPGLIVLRSFGKFYGLPGLRLGWLAGPARLCQQMRDLMGHWPLNSAAIHTATEAYSNLRWQRATRSRLQRAQRRLADLLERYSVQVLGGTELFLYITHPQIAALWHVAAREGLYLRRFDEYPDRLRIGLPADKDAEERLRVTLQNWSLGL